MASPENSLPPVRCLACGGETTRVYLVTSGSHGFEIHGMEKTGLGTSRRRCPVSERVCTECGYVMQFATEPRKFVAELRPELAPAERLPIPAGPDGHLTADPGAPD